VVVEKMDISEGSNKGDNFACVMKAVTAHAKVKGEGVAKPYHFMAKCMPMNPVREKGLREVSGGGRGKERERERK
jgi:hypothetical protein